MAARIEAAPTINAPDLVDLRQLSSYHLEGLLEEESRAWSESLDWDFSKSADLVRRYVDLRALSGAALLAAGAAAGYSYFVLEEHKALVGDLYVTREFRTVANEDRLLGAVLAALMSNPQVRRIESQLMMILAEPGRILPGSRFLSTFERNFMLLDFAQAPGLVQKALRYPVYFEKWAEHHQETGAQLIAAAYAGHVDSWINDQYRSLAGARRFLYNIVQYPGCGNFFRPASYVALDTRKGNLCGLSLASLVGPEAGHITQICVSPAVRGTGVGYELLRLSLADLRQHGCRRVSLTVTASNREAVELYERTGFHTLRKFTAYVWEGFARP